jgi:soluble lytic murein transglycosylase-like protein
MRLALEGAGNASLASQLKKLEDGRRRLAEKYDGYVAELGVYRRLTEDERPIYRMARAFNEAEVSMPVSFVRLVRETMAGYWLTPAGRSRFERAIRSAETRGHTRRIVETLRRYGLPPQLFYVALQESNLETSAVGPLTRWGRAKGMWQLIPSTAIRFGLDPGPFANQEGVDAGDERFDFAKSTEAAARYLQTIYGTLAQASGLLVVASYNWGEHRVVDKLENLTGPQSIPPEALAGIGENPRDRTYWRFLVEYRDRMPDETRDYVLKIFSAAVIGEDPRRHGFALDNPLARYVEEG